MGGEGQERDLVGVLAHAQLAQHERGELERGGRQGRLQTEQMQGDERVGDRDPWRLAIRGRTDEVDHGGVGVGALGQAMIRTSVCSPASAAPRSRRGTTITGSRPGITTSIVESRSRGIAS